MVRTVFATCAGLLLPLGSLVCAGCGARADSGQSPPQAAPVLLELQAMAPGPWKRLDPPSVAPAAVEAEVGQPSAPPVERPSDDPADNPDGPVDITITFDSPASSERPDDDAPLPTDPIELAVPPTVKILPGGESGPNRLPPTELVVSPAPTPSVHDAPPASEAAEQTPLPWAGAPRKTQEIASVTRRANELVRHGFALAANGALYSARKDFLDALRLIAGAHDAQQNTHLHATSLAAGLAALEESRSFAAAGPSGATIDVESLAASHKTPVLKQGQAGRPSAAEAAEQYYRYAQEQLAAAAAREATGSMALFGMAKLATVQAADQPARAAEHLAQAKALYQAALLAEPNNFCAASELGVLLVESGDYRAARELLIRSVSIAPHAVTWHNLAAVHARLGETQVAEQAAARAGAREQQASKASVPNVEWVDPQAFSRITSESEKVLPAMPPARPGAPQVPVDVAKKGFSDWVPSVGRR